MQDRSHRGVPARLSRLEKQFTVWRAHRVKGARITKPLWNSAVASAVDFGVSQTATVLKLDYYGLKKRVERQRSTMRKTASTNAFVEIASPLGSLARECVIEFEDGCGASMRVHLKGTDVPDVHALGRTFWKGE